MRNAGENNISDIPIEFVSPQSDLIYKKNLAAIKANYPEYVERIEKASLNVKYRAVLAGPKRALNIFNLEKNLFYYDISDCEKDIDIQIQELELRNTRIAVFLGFGLGFEVDYYARKYVASQNTSFIIILENDLELFKTAMSYIDYTPMISSKKIRLLLGEEEQNILPIMENLFRANDYLIYLLKCVRPVYHLSSIKLNREYYLAALKMINESLIVMLNYFGNSPKDSLVGVVNMLDNLDEIISNPGINHMYGKFANRPAVVVSTGPSLNKNKHLLKGLEDKALLICPDASLHILLEMGVKPHIVVSLERTNGILKFLQNTDEEATKDIYYAACPVITKDVYKAYKGPKIIVYRNLSHFKWLNIDKGILDIRASSGNMAFKLAQALGCNPIILIGQDLALGSDGKTHASGMVLGDKINAHYERGLIEVMGNEGKPVVTSNILYPFIKDFEIDIWGYSGRCINSTEGGAYIKGTEVMPFSKAIEAFLTEEFFPRALIKDSLAEFKEDNAQKDLLNVAMLLECTKNDLLQINAYCDKGIELIQNEYEVLQNMQSMKNFTETQQDKITSIYHAVNEYKKKVLEARKHTLQLFLLHIIQSYHIQFENDINSLYTHYPDKFQAELNIVLKHGEWFKTVKQIGELCISALEDASNKLKHYKKG